MALGGGTASTGNWPFTTFGAYGRHSNAQSFPRFELGGEQDELAGPRCGNSSPLPLFTIIENEPFPAEPKNLTPVEYLETWANGATPQEGVALAAAFLREMQIAD